jgi:hypothetical protein
MSTVLYMAKQRASRRQYITMIYVPDREENREKGFSSLAVARPNISALAVKLGTGQPLF